MSTKYKFNSQHELYFITFAVVGWIDLFVRSDYRDILLQSWQYCIPALHTCASRGGRSIILYDSDIGNDCNIDTLSLVMKGETLSPETDWTGSPVKPA